MKQIRIYLTILFSIMIFNNLAVFAETKKQVLPSVKKQETNVILEKKTVQPAEKVNSAAEQINLKIKNEDKKVIKVSEPIKKIDGHLFETNPDKLQQAFQIQKKMDVDDIRTLWEATVERNTVIKFALRKLATPPEQRRIHSSLMAKSVSALISGASILPGIFGIDGITSTASLAGGSLASKVLESRTLPKEMPLTDTELIQLAELVESLQNRLINNYYDYKSSLEALKVCRQNIMLQNKNYNEAIKSGNEMSIIVSSSLYDKELYNELRLKQKIKLHEVELERLAGPQIVARLNLTKLASFNVNPEKTLTDVKQSNEPKKNNKGPKSE